MWDVNFLYGCYTDNVDINLFELIPIVDNDFCTRANNQEYFVFQYNVVQKLTYKYFYSQCIVTIWNKLPSNIKNEIVMDDSSKFIGITNFKLDLCLKLSLSVKSNHILQHSSSE